MSVIAPIDHAVPGKALFHGSNCLIRAKPLLLSSAHAPLMISNLFRTLPLSYFLYTIKFFNAKPTTNENCILHCYDAETRCIDHLQDVTDIAGANCIRLDHCKRTIRHKLYSYNLTAQR